MNTKHTENIKIFALGGVGEIGKNMYVIEVDEAIFVVDAGLMLPEDEMLGIDIVIPDISYLVENKHRIKGIFLTHGHEEHIGALSYVLHKIKVPIYGTKLTLSLVKEKIKELGQNAKIEFHEVQASTKIEMGNVMISFFKTNHSIPDSVGICFHTSQGVIVNTGDFKFDQTSQELYGADIASIAKIGQEGVLCLLSDSTNAEIAGYSVPERVISQEISDVFYNAKGRIIVTAFASNIIRIQQIFDAAKEHGRKIAIMGKGLFKVIELSLQLGYLRVEEDTIIPLRDLGKYPDEEIAILVTGSQGEPISTLSKMAKGTHKITNVKKEDTVMIAAVPRPGNELFFTKTIDLIYRAGASVISGKQIHVSDHGYQEELKLMLNLTKPKYFIPVHGEYRMQVAHAKIAKSVGVADENIFIIEKGEVIEFKDGIPSTSKKVPSGNTLIDGLGVGDVGNIVLRDRRLLSQDGILIVVVTINKDTKQIAAGPEIISRGFVYVRESEKLFEESTTIVNEIVLKCLKDYIIEWSTLKQNIREALNQFLYEKTKRRPMVLPIIMEI